MQKEKKKKNRKNDGFLFLMKKITMKRYCAKKTELQCTVFAVLRQRKKHREISTKNIF